MLIDQRKHRILPGELATLDTSDAGESVLAQQMAASKRPRLYEPIPRVRAQRVKELALAFIIDTDQPFTTFSNGYFQEMLGVFDPSLAAQLAWGRTSFEDLRKAFQAKQKVIKAEIEAALSTIHISFDLWTSPNRYAMIAIFAHFIDKRGRPQDLLLALRRQLGTHSGNNIATTLGEVIKDWDLDIFRSVVVSDDALNNDSCVAAFFASFSPILTHEDIKARRIRCFGHIWNLIAKAFFFWP